MSSDLIIVKVNKKALLKKFVRFPYDLYEGDKYWVPPLMMEEIKSLRYVIGKDLGRLQLSRICIMF